MRCRSFIFVAVCALNLFAIKTNAEPTAPPRPPAAVLSPDNPQTFDPAAATKAWLDTVPADKRAKSDAYFKGGYWLLLWDFLIGAAIAIFLLQSRISARLRDWAERITRATFLQIILYVIPFVIIFAVLSFPMSIYEQFVREHQYGLATQTFGAWLGDQAKSLFIGLIAASIALPILYAVVRRATRTWWIWATVVAVILSIFANFIAPVFIFPLFNKYTPLSDPAIRDPILAMARGNQIPVDQVFVVDASRQTTRVSANVAGAFGTTRIALNDNLLNQCTLPEIRAVMAHEMGHFILNHGGKLTTYQGIFFLLEFAARRALQRRHAKMGRTLGRARHRRHRGVAVGFSDLQRAKLFRHADQQYHHTHH